MPQAHSHPPARPEGPGRRPRLHVYVATHCPNCREARRLAEQAAARFPAANVRVINLDQDDAAPPEAVVAVPTYVLDGAVISLGNPAPEELFARLRRAAGGRA